MDLLVRLLLVLVAIVLAIALLGFVVALLSWIGIWLFQNLDLAFRFHRALHPVLAWALIGFLVGAAAGFVKRSRIYGMERHRHAVWVVLVVVVLASRLGSHALALDAIPTTAYAPPRADPPLPPRPAAARPAVVTSPSTTTSSIMPSPSMTTSSVKQNESDPVGPALAAARAKMASGDLRGALLDCEEALKRDPRRMEARVLRQRVLALRDEAVEEHLRLARLKWAAEGHQAAIAECDRALELDPASQKVRDLKRSITRSQDVLSGRGGETGAENHARLSVRAYNCDDGCRVYLNGRVVVQVGLGEDSGQVEVTHSLERGTNTLAFEVINERGAISYGFEAWKGEQLAFSRICGQVLAIGCNANRDYPRGSQWVESFSVVQ